MDLDLAAVTAPAQVVEVLVHQGSVEEPPVIDAGQALTMDDVIPAPLCAALITCAHAPPLASTSNQLFLTSAGTAAPLHVTWPSFPPVMQGPISMLPGAPTVFSGAPGAPVAPPAPYGSMTSMPWSSQPTPYASAFMAPPALPMYMPTYMPRSLTHPPFMQAQFEELVRQRQDIEAQELEVQRMSRTHNLNAVRDARVRSATSVRGSGSKRTRGKEQAPEGAGSQLASQRSQTPSVAPPSGIEVISMGVSQTVAPPTTSQVGAIQNMESMVQGLLKSQFRVIPQETPDQTRYSLILSG